MVEPVTPKLDAAARIVFVPLAKLRSVPDWAQSVRKASMSRRRGLRALLLAPVDEFRVESR